MSAMSPYLSDCIPDERVATQPPSVLWVKLSGKWPMVQPLAPSCRSMSGPRVPAWIRASPDCSSMSISRLSRPRSTDSTGRGSSGGASRLPEMLLPPPNGISTASSATATSTIRCTSASSPGYSTTSGIRGMSAVRSRTRSRRLLPYVCTIRVWGSVCRCPWPTMSLNGALQVLAEFRFRDRQRRQIMGNDGRDGDVEVHRLGHERREAGLVLVLEPDPLHAPAPPLHVGDVLRVDLAGLVRLC